MDKCTYNPCDECKYGIDRRDGSGNDAMCRICEFRALLNRRAQPESTPLTRCADCEHWDKSISFMLSAHACAYWSPSRENPRYTEGFEFCSFARSKPEEVQNER